MSGREDGGGELSAHEEPETRERSPPRGVRSLADRFEQLSRSIETIEDRLSHRARGRQNSRQHSQRRSRSKSADRSRSPRRRKGKGKGKGASNRRGRTPSPSSSSSAESTSYGSSSSSDSDGPGSSGESDWEAPMRAFHGRSSMAKDTGASTSDRLKTTLEEAFDVVEETGPPIQDGFAKIVDSALRYVHFKKLLVSVIISDPCSKCKSEDPPIVEHNVHGKHWRTWFTL